MFLHWLQSLKQATRKKVLLNNMLMFYVVVSYIFEPKLLPKCSSFGLSPSVGPFYLLQFSHMNKSEKSVSRWDRLYCSVVDVVVVGNAAAAACLPRIAQTFCQAIFASEIITFLKWFCFCFEVEMKTVFFWPSIKKDEFVRKIFSKLIFKKNYDHSKYFV